MTDGAPRKTCAPLTKNSSLQNRSSQQPTPKASPHGLPHGPVTGRRSRTGRGGEGTPSDCPGPPGQCQRHRPLVRGVEAPGEAPAPQDSSPRLARVTTDTGPRTEHRCAGRAPPACPRARAQPHAPTSETGHWPGAADRTHNGRKFSAGGGAGRDTAPKPQPRSRAAQDGCGRRGGGDRDGGQADGGAPPGRAPQTAGGAGRAGVGEGSAGLMTSCFQEETIAFQS